MNGPVLETLSVWGSCGYPDPPYAKAFGLMVRMIDPGCLHPGDLLYDAQVLLEGRPKSWLWSHDGGGTHISAVGSGDSHRANDYRFTMVCDARHNWRVQIDTLRGQLASVRLAETDSGRGVSPVVVTKTKPCAGLYNRAGS